jgi:hypothetical protein
VYALPAKFGLSGIPGISGRERGVEAKRHPLWIGGFALPSGSSPQGEKLGEGDAHVVAPSPSLCPLAGERNMKWSNERINDAKSGKPKLAEET